MANRNTQEAEVIVTLNGSAAKKAVAEMKEEYKQLTEAARDAYKAGNDALGKKLDAQAQKLTKDIEITQRETKKFADILKNVNGASLKELNSAAKQLRSEISKLTPGTQEFVSKSKQLQQVNTRINQLKGSFKGLVAEEKAASLSLKGLADGFNKYFGMVTAGIAAVTGISMAFRKSAEEAAKLDDVYSDVMKTTGLLHDEVAELDKDLMKIDTRTSREQLLLLARDAGKLGIQGKENILGFVRAADQIQVALGEDLGEGAIRNLGKIADVLGYTDSMGIEKSLLSIGSAINAVGQASTASEGYLVDFTQRLAGVAAQTGISAANIIGFASGLDQSAMKVEMASTAFQKFLMKLYEDPAKFAAYANLEVGKFTDLLQNDANQAVITILKALKDQDGFASLVPIFKDMGLDGARAVSVLAAMATNINAVTEAQALANVEFSKATSVTEEYNTKNNNMQAQLEKARKEFQNASIALGQSLNPIMLKSTKATTYLIKALAQYGKEIKTVLVVIVALTAALKAKTIWLQIVATWNATIKAGSLALAAAQALLAGNVTRAAAAWALMNTAMKASVFGLVAAAIAGLVIWIQRLGKETKQLTEYQKFEKQLTEDISKVTSEEAARVKALKSIVEDSNQAYQERKLALQELKRMVPDYHADLTEEGVLINNNTEALDGYIEAMLKAAKTQALQDKLRENANKQFEQTQYLEENAPQEFKYVNGEWRRSYSEAVDYGGQRMGLLTHWISKDCEAAIDRLEEFKKEEQLILGMIRNVGESSLIPTSGGTGGSGDGPKGPSMTDKEAKKAYDNEIKQLEEHQRAKENVLKRSLMNQEITQAEYNARMNLLTMEGLQGRIDIAKKYGQDTTKYTSQLLDEEIKLVGDGMAELEEKMTDLAPKSNIVDPQANEQFWDEIYKKREDIVAQLQDKSLKTQYDTEMMWLEKLHQNEMLSEEEFQKAKFQTKLKYAQQYAEQYNSLASQAGDMVKALQDAELAQAEAKYQAELAAAGDNAEEKERIEAEHEKKKLEIQKKYADADMIINIAKTIGAGALAIMQAFAQLGPVAGAVAAAMIGVTTAAEVATIIAQRNAIKNASAGGGSGSASLNTGTRTITGYSEGGNTPWAASDDTPVGVVHANEWVAPAWMKRREPLLFASLERYRKAGSHGRSGSMSSGFAAGGNTGSGALAISQGGDLHSAVKVAIVDAFESGAIRVVLVRKDLSELDAQSEKFTQMTSRS